MPAQTGVGRCITLVPYYRTALALGPVKEVSKLNKPTLVIGGHCDIQVTVSHAEALHEAVPQAKLVLVDAMGHVMKDLEADCSNARIAYTDPSLALSPILVREVIAFLRGI